MAFEQGLEQESGSWPGVAPAFEPETELVEPKRLKVQRVEAKTRIPAMMIQKNWWGLQLESGR